LTGVTFTGNGSIDDVRGLKFLGWSNTSSLINPPSAVVFNPGPVEIPLFKGVTQTGIFGDGGPMSPSFPSSSSANTEIGVGGPNGTLFAVNPGYTLGATISANMTFDGETFASLGITPGASVIWSWGDGGIDGGEGDRVVLNVVPEPTSIAMFGIAMVGLARRRR
jgi:hypothetical protein